MQTWLLDLTKLKMPAAFQRYAIFSSVFVYIDVKYHFVLNVAKKCYTFSWEEKFYCIVFRREVSSRNAEKKFSRDWQSSNQEEEVTLHGKRWNAIVSSEWSRNDHSKLNNWILFWWNLIRRKFSPTEIYLLFT